MNLTEKERKLVLNLAKHTGMDCWFYLTENKGVDIVLDLERNVKRSFRKAFSELIEGTNPEGILALTDDEKVTLVYLLSRCI